MVGDLAAGYLGGLPRERAAELARVNEPGLTALRGYLASGQAVAFLGAGVSAPLYPLWDGLIVELVEAAAPRLSEREAATCRALARESPEEVVEIVRQQLGVASYREVLREVLRPRTDPESGRSWTAVQELVCRCAFKAVVTTNYDPGIVDARMRVRPGASATGFTTWEDELGLDRWRTGDVFGEAELPVLFAHGQHNKPDSVVLATTEYRRAYAGKLPQVLARLMDGHLAWLGFSFADQRIAAILREVAERAGTRIEPGSAPRHVAVMAWDPGAPGNDPGVLTRRAEIGYGARLVLYPAPGGDHSALGRLLAALADDRFGPVGDLPVRLASPPDASASGAAEEMHGVPVRWVPTAERVEHFTGRGEELARLDRWAAGPQVALVGVTAWGGAGKTALVTRWVLEAGGTGRRPGVRGVFGWSFYADPSAEHWARRLLEWARQDLGVAVAGHRPAGRGGTGRAAGGAGAAGAGRARGGTGGSGRGRVRTAAGWHAARGAGRRLPAARRRAGAADLPVPVRRPGRLRRRPPPGCWRCRRSPPPRDPRCWTRPAAGWLPDGQRRDLVRAVDGHALATGVLAGLLAARPPAADLATLRAELDAAARTDTTGGPGAGVLLGPAGRARPVPAGRGLAVRPARPRRGGAGGGWP